MKTTLSPLRCRTYFVTELTLTANPLHKADQPQSLDFKDLQTTAAAEPQPQAKEPRTWMVTLRVQQNAAPEKNAPYNFTISLVGHFIVHPSYPEAGLRQLVEINGASILYSAARQILRDAMSSGPYRPLLLPTVAFQQDAPPATQAAGTEPVDKRS